jgi:hypothetical protein
VQGAKIVRSAVNPGLAKRWCCMDNVVPAPKFPEMSKRSLGLAPGNLRMISVARSGDDLTVTT